MNFDIAKFSQSLKEESDYPLSDEIFGCLLDNSDMLEFSKGDAVVEIGTMNPDIYIICEGIVRGYLIANDVEANIYFGMEGTLLSSMQSFSLMTPAKVQVEACCNVKALRIRKEVFGRMMKESHEFCLWVAGVFTRRSCYDELKSVVMNGDAKWRYEWLERCRPELFKHVPLKAIASYLKMTEVHVSRIRRMIAKRNKR